MSFASDLQRFARLANKSMDSIVRDVTFEWFSSVVIASPVGNPDDWKNPERAPPGYVGGRFRGNWQCGVGSAPDGTIAGVRPQADVVNEINSKLPAGAGFEVFLSNNLPYSARLEYDGWSKQAKRGIVRVNTTRVQGIIRRKIQEHKV